MRGEQHVPEEGIFGGKSGADMCLGRIYAVSGAALCHGCADAE